MVVKQDNERTLVTEWLVLLKFDTDPVVVSPEEGVELYANVAKPGDTYHRMRREPNHTLSVIPDCLPDSLADLGVRTTATAMLESMAQALGAKPCPDCRWKKKQA